MRGYSSVDSMSLNLTFNPAYQSNSTIQISSSFRQ